VWSKHEKYLAKSESVSSDNPSKCLNCLQCISVDLKRCPVIRDYSNEITELISYKLVIINYNKLIFNKQKFKIKN
jgi:hypothetical protein